MTKILAIGNAICDVLYEVTDEVITKLNLVKGSMTLCNVEQINDIIASLNNICNDFVLSSGGSAANTAYILKMQNIETAFLGNVADDFYGKKYALEMADIGVEFINGRSSLNSDTAKSIILITPDGERTMCTYLGCASNIKVPNNLLDKFQDLEYIYLEGYLWDNDLAVQEIIPLIKEARKKNIKIVFSLSDSFCVSRNLEKFKDLFKEDIDIIFANEEEINSFFAINIAELDYASLIQNQFNNNNIAYIVITRNDKGSCIISKNDQIEIPTRKLAAIDSTGAGDSFAAGFLAKILKTNDLSEAASNANFIAGQVIMNIGARPGKIEVNNNLGLYNEANN